VLARLANAGTHVHRLQWLVRTVPDDGNAIRAYLKRARPRDLDQASAVIRSYLELVRLSGPASSQHTTLLVVQLASRTAARAIRAAGGGDHGACVALAQAMEQLAEAWTAWTWRCGGCWACASTRGCCAPPSTPRPWPT
jgi:hypothetical protein